MQFNFPPLPLSSQLTPEGLIHLVQVVINRVLLTNLQLMLTKQRSRNSKNGKTIRTLLKLKFVKYPAIHTNYIISHSTTLPYNHNIGHGI